MNISFRKIVGERLFCYTIFRMDAEKRGGLSMFAPSSLKLVVFDLDGTIYEETHHFDYYAERIAEKLPDVQAQRFWQDYRDSLEGKHTLKIGRAYDALNDRIIAHRRLTPQAVWNWEGATLDRDVWHDDYSPSLDPRRQNIVLIGDQWWLPATVAIHYGISKEKLGQAFLETRAFMQSDAFPMRPIPGLRDWIVTLKKEGTHVALMTNSPEEDSRAIIDKLGLTELFDTMIFLAEKPLRTEAHLKRLLQISGAAPEEGLSVGDNWQNDIAPAGAIGMKTLLIDSHGLAEPGDADLVYPSLSSALKTMLNVSSERA